MQKELEAKVSEVVKNDLPEGFKDYSADIKGYVLVLSSPMQERLTIAYEGDVQVPKKNGDGFKRQKIKTSIQAKYCPFCGQLARAEEPES
jgi:hypothetical protein